MPKVYTQCLKVYILVLIHNVYGKVYKDEKSRLVSLINFPVSLLKSLDSGENAAVRSAIQIQRKL